MEKGESFEILLDKKATISISKDIVFHRRTKHFNIKFYLLMEVQKNIEVVLFYCKSENQVADISTKSLHASIFEFLTESCDVAVFDSGGVLFYILRTYLNGLETSSDY